MRRGRAPAGPAGRPRTGLATDLCCHHTGTTNACASGEADRSLRRRKPFAEGKLRLGRRRPEVKECVVAGKGELMGGGQCFFFAVAGSSR
jgi:hypothetical protein